MTEEIIIGKKDVVACNYWKACDYYKQLKRLEQENKELKKQIESQKGLITVGGKQQYEYLQKIDELEQENKELKNIIKIHDSTKYDYYKLMKENEEWHIKYAGCNTANSAIQEENKKYRSVLEEIREILLEHSCADSHTTKYITDKINEVLNP